MWSRDSWKRYGLNSLTIIKEIKRANRIKMPLEHLEKEKRVRKGKG